MTDGAGEILKRLAKTGLLVACLGAALYGVAASVAELSYGRWVFTLVLAGPMTAFMGFVVQDALRTGEIAVWRQAVLRAQEPARYWFNLGWYAVAGVLLGIMALWSLAELLAVLAGSA